MAQPAPITYPLSSILEPVKLDTLFPNRRPLEVELGCGDGSFLVAWARETPNRNFIGTERLLGRLRKLDRKGRKAALLNLRGIRIESSYFLQYLLPPHCATALHIYFPDPWPKRKHARYRLISESFPALAQHALVPGGDVFLRTDDEPYFTQMRSVFGSSKGFTPVETPSDLLAIKTDFEREFNAQGLPTLHTAYHRVGNPVS